MKDMEDIYEMRFSGAFYAACETRWSMIHIDELILDVVEGFTDTQLMRMVTENYWKRFAYLVNVSFEMYGFVLWKTRTETIRVKNDPDRKRLFGENANENVKVDVPYVLPFMSVPIEPTVDEKGREIIQVMDKNGKPDKSVHVSYSRHGNLRALTQKFETECGSILEEWRRFNRIIKLHDFVVDQNARLAPFVEHMPASEQARLREETGMVESLLHPNETDSFGYPRELETVLKKVVKETDEPAQSFVEIPKDRKLSASQPRPQMAIDLHKEYGRMAALYAATLQIPLRSLGFDEKATQRRDNVLAIEEDIARAVRSANDRRNRIVDVLKEAFFACHGQDDVVIHLPTASQMQVDTLFALHERRIFDDHVVKEELGTMLGLKKDRFSKMKIYNPNDH